MRRPVPNVFQGSMSTHVGGCVRLQSDIEWALGSSALLLAFGAWGLTSSLLSPSCPWLAVKIGCGVLLAVSLLGLWLKRKALQAPQLETTGIYQAVLRRMADSGGAIRNAPAEGGYAGLTGLIGDLASLLHRMQAGRAKLEADLAAGHSASRKGRQQAQRIARAMSKDAETLSDAAARVDFTGLHLVREAAGAARSLEMADTAVARAIDGISAVAASVRATTSGAQQMTAAAVQMAEIAHTTHRCVADLDDKTAKLVLALDSIEQVLQVATARQASSIGVAENEVLNPSLASIALEWQEVAGGCQPVLGEAGAAMRDLIAHTVDAHRRTMEIADLVAANHEIGRAVSHAVERQGQEIARILTELYESRPGFATLRAGVEAVTLACATSTEAADTLRQSAKVLPAQAEALANILRSLPDLPASTDY